MAVEVLNFIEDTAEEVRFTEQDEAFLRSVGATATPGEIVCKPKDPDEDDRKSGGSTRYPHRDHPVNPEGDDDDPTGDDK